MAAKPDDDSPQPYQRRIGARHPIHLPLDWGPVPQGRWRRKTERWTVTTHDISVSGFGFESDTRPDMHRGRPVVITFGEISATAIVRVAKPGHKPGLTYYGLEFQDEAMLGHVKEVIAAYLAERRLAEPAPGADDSALVQPTSPRAVPDEPDWA